MANEPAHEDELLHQIERFRTATGMAETTFGRSAVRDPNLIAGIRSGRELRRGTLARIRSFMEAHQ
ncbi:hypothetical protein [Sphingomonas sp. 3-13AW]|uniref:hypothetical protein n=1 Tax=Sphingomonas sp. 3-13AW TaxID=3050450 RepID=UPI003BB50AB5